MKKVIFIAITFLFALGSANAQIELNGADFIRPFDGDCSELSFEEGKQVGCSLANNANGVISSNSFLDFPIAKATYDTYKHCSEYISGFLNGWAECRDVETFTNNLGVGNSTTDCDLTGGCGTGFKCVGGKCVPI